METTTSAPSSIPHVEPATPSLKPLELSFPLPRTPHTTLHIHLTFMATSSLVFLSTTTPGDSSGGQSGGASLRPMGSFVYAMPDVSFILRRLYCIIIMIIPLFAFSSSFLSATLQWREAGIL